MIGQNDDRLLTRYATGQATPDEQKELFERSLENQELFEAVGDLTPARAAVLDPASRSRILDNMLPRPSRRSFWRLASFSAVAASVTLVAVAGWRTHVLSEELAMTRTRADELTTRLDRLTGSELVAEVQRPNLFGIQRGPDEVPQEQRTVIRIEGKNSVVVLRLALRKDDPALQNEALFSATISNNRYEVTSRNLAVHGTPNEPYIELALPARHFPDGAINLHWAAGDSKPYQLAAILKRN